MRLAVPPGKIASDVSNPIRPRATSITAISGHDICPILCRLAGKPHRISTFTGKGDIPFDVTWPKDRVKGVQDRSWLARSRIDHNVNPRNHTVFASLIAAG
jgi:hypothetical protein